MSKPQDSDDRPARLSAPSEAVEDLELTSDDAEGVVGSFKRGGSSASPNTYQSPKET